VSPFCFFWGAPSGRSTAPATSLQSVSSAYALTRCRQLRRYLVGIGGFFFHSIGLAFPRASAVFTRNISDNTGEKRCSWSPSAIWLCGTPQGGDTRLQSHSSPPHADGSCAPAAAAPCGYRPARSAGRPRKNAPPACCPCRPPQQPYVICSPLTRSPLSPFAVSPSGRHRIGSGLLLFGWPLVAAQAARLSRYVRSLHRGSLWSPLVCSGT